ncbi:uncharacterized protein CPUR_07896 [Claviceps purpurea 20.1]|uniref:Uncharacterized protein n=1 Tax=Claviceps purpurea (strain 20.1) TaxID=1111077 RepID=M1WFV1_CLAP2|nr:uncharacterized protein CPUR_07896 [Claviceps purpurea 20.1]
MDSSPIKAEKSADHRKSGYKSWKKKYRKMRIVFDQKMQEGEDLHKKEEKASATVKRLAVENDRLLDLLLDINNSPQIPFDKRIDVSLKPTSSKLVLPLDKKHTLQLQLPMKHLSQLVEEIPHLSYSAAKASKCPYVADLMPPDGETYPCSFLSADDVDNYLHDIDSLIDPETHIPTLAPRAHPISQPLTHPHLKNPTSVTNWLRKNAPKIFLQDSEAHDGDDDGHTGGHTGGKKTRGGSRSERGAGRGRGKRTSIASRAAERERQDWDPIMDEDVDVGTPVSRGGKRKRDDDPGYRPGGSLGRPVKKKRKSDLDSPAVRKSKKETHTPKRDE